MVGAMLNDLKDWAVDKGDQTKQIAHGVANEVQTTSVMEWSSTVWLVIAGIVILALIGMVYSR